MTELESLPAVELEFIDNSGMIGQFEANKKTFWAMREQLLARYEGQYVAVYEGRVVDHDIDKITLGQRVYKQFGYRPIYVQLVSHQGLPVKRIASPRRPAQR